MSVWDDLASGSDSTWGSGWGDTSSSVPMMSSIGAAGFGLGALGTAGSMFSGYEASQAQSQAYGAQMNIANLGMQINQQREQQMILTSQRQNIENLRNVQKAQAMGKASAVQSGAQFGSGLAGAQGSEAAQGAMNTRNISQNLQIGETIFGLNNQIGMQEINYAQDMSKANNWLGMGSISSGLGSLGMGLMQAAPALAML